MAVETVIVEETTQEQEVENKEIQTVPIEQFEELKEKFELSQKSNSGLDSKITELQKLFKTREQERENEKKTVDQKNTDAITELQKAFDQERMDKIKAVNKSLASQMIIDADLKVPKSINRLVGKTEEETIKFVTDYIEDIKEGLAADKDIYAKKNGRKVVDTTQKSVEKMSYEDMVNLSDEKFNAIPKDIVNKAMDTALKRK